jgi:plasmid stability protein
MHMSKMIQIRNVPDEVHKRFKVRAAEAGMTLSDYLLAEMEVLAARPSAREWMARVKEINALAAPPPPNAESAADSVRAARTERESELDDPGSERNSDPPRR